MNPSILQFQPQPIPTVAAVVLITLFLLLGFWQLERAEQKRNLADILDIRHKLPPFRLTEKTAADEQFEHRNLSAEGIFIPEKTIFIENRKYMGRSGFHVITPLSVNGSSHYLLVNRGWVAEQKNHPFPSIETPGESVSVTGRAIIPLPPALELDDGSLSANSNPRWPYLTLERYARWSGLDIFPFVLLQSDTDAYGFVRSWQPEIPNVGMHIGYAIQWFAFALIVFFIWLRLSLNRRTEGGLPNHDDH